jgi:hypothetical protein
MFRGLVILMLAGLIALAFLAGCGGQQEPAMEETTPPAMEEAMPTDTAADTTETMTDTIE